MMKRTILLILVVPLIGCGALFSYEKKAPPPMPEPVRVSPTLSEMESAAFAWEREALEEVRRAGASPRAPLVEQAIEAHDAAHLRFPSPTKPWPKPETTDKRVLEVDSKIARLRGLAGQYRAKVATWWARYEKQRGTPVTTGWSVKSGALGWLVGTLPGMVIILVILGMIGVPVIPLMFKALVLARKGLRGSETVVKQVAGAIDKFKADGAPQEVSRLKAHLGENMDAASKLAVDKARRA